MENQNNQREQGRSSVGMTIPVALTAVAGALMFATASYWNNLDLSCYEAGIGVIDNCQGVGMTAYVEAIKGAVTGGLGSAGLVSLVRIFI